MKHIPGAGALMALLVTTMAHAAALPAESTAITEQELRRGVLDFNRRTLVETYKAVGKHDPKWDEPALKLLNGIAVYFTNANMDPRYKVAGAVPDEEMCAAGKAAMDAGCDDPQVLYVYAAILDDTNQDDEALPLLRRSLELFPQSRYPINRAFNTAARMLRHATRLQDPKRDEYAQQAHDCALASMALGDFKGLDRRCMADQIGDWLESLPMAEQQRFIDDAAKLECDPWMFNYLAGKYRVDAAWDARGSGWSYTVTDEGWDGFRKHLDEARKHLLKAHHLEPKFPEPAAEMITVAMGSGSGDERIWFERATAAQLDYDDAYSRLRMALRPRWGGSYQEMIELAEQCRDSGRYDTSVPYKAVDTIWEIVDDMDGDLAIWQEDRVYDVAMDVLSRYAKQAQDDKSKRNYQALMLAVEWYRGDYAAARKLLDELNGVIDWPPVKRFRYAGWRIADEVYAFSGRFADELLAAQKLCETDLTAARGAYAEIQKKLPRNEPGARFITFRARELQMLEAFEKGYWAKIQPGPSMQAWEHFDGRWKVEKDGTLVGTSSGSHLTFLCTTNFGTRYELAGTVEIDPNERVKEANGGPIVAWLNNYDHYGMWLRRTSQQAVMRYGRYYTTAWPAEIKDVNTFHIQIWDQHASGSINGQPIFSAYEMNDYAATVESRIGVGAQFFTKGGIVKFRDLKIRKLTSPPPAATTRPTTNPSGMRRPTTASRSQPRD